MILEVLGNAIIRQEREIKVILNWKEEIKMVFVCRIHLEIQKEPTKNSCNISNYSKVAAKKVNIGK